MEADKASSVSRKSQQAGISVCIRAIVIRTGVLCAVQGDCQVTCAFLRMTSLTLIKAAPTSTMSVHTTCLRNFIRLPPRQVD